MYETASVKFEKLKEMSSPEPLQSLRVCYEFAFPDGKEQTFVIELPLDDDSTTSQTGANPEGWTELGFQKCRNCPLNEDDVKHCPAATGMQDLVEAFADKLSYETASVRVVTKTRTYSKEEEVPLQDALKSIMGLQMATSGCPVLAKLRPMAYFHLPFANLEETLVRVVGTYLTAQYFRHKKGLSIDMELDELKEMYQKIHKVNVDFLKRLQKASEEDANLNALVNLDVFATMIPLSIDRNLPSLEALFSPYLKD